MNHEHQEFYEDDQVFAGVEKKSGTCPGLKRNNDYYTVYMV
jgi:hypothetical protein